MTADEIRAAVEAGRECVDGLKQAISQTGEGYVVVTVGGVVAEGEAAPFAATDEAAAEGLLRSLRAYADEVDPDRKGTLYWRVHPELELSTYGIDPATLEKVNYPEPRYYGYARLLISSQPEIPEIVETYRQAVAEMAAQENLPRPETRTILTLHKAERRIEIALCDEADYIEKAGEDVASGLTEREALHRLMDNALDVLEGKSRSVCEPERFATMRSLVRSTEHGPEGVRP